MSATEEATGTVAAPDVEENLSPEEAQARLQALNQVCQELTRKINELDMDRTEHGLVIDALKPLDSGRKCFRMVGDVVVERTIAEVAPAVLKNRDAIVETMNKMGEAQPALSKGPSLTRSSPTRPPTAPGARPWLRAILWVPSGEPPPRGCRREAARGPGCLPAVADLTAFGHPGTGTKAAVRRRVCCQVQGERAEPAARRC